MATGTRYYEKSIEDCFQDLNSRSEGLNSSEVESIQAQVGENAIPKQKISFIEKYIKPVINLMMVILFISAILQIFLGEIFGPILVLTILTINFLIAIFQQYKVEKTLEALEKLTAFKATVLRNNMPTETNANDLVPGDILILRQGDYISADARLFELNEFSVDESILTGESVPVTKSSQIILTNSIQIQEQKNMVFSSTFVASGNAKAIVTATGINTEIGKISKGIAQKETREIPLQKQVNKLATGLGILVLVVISALLIIQLIKNPENIVDEISWLISLAVAAIPFNFPLIITIILLSGVLHLARKQAIVRKLNAIETIGRLSVICSDKTGTLTQNQMTVQKIYYNQQLYEVSGTGYEKAGEIQINGQSLNLEQDPYLRMMFVNAAVNNNSELIEEEVNIRKGTKKILKVIGMPTEGALYPVVQKAGIEPLEERNKHKIIKEYSFSSERKRMSKIVEVNNLTFCLTKGAPEKIIELSTQTIVNGQIVSFTEELKQQTFEKLNFFASQGLRNLGFGYKNLEPLSLSQLEDISSEKIENNFIFLGFMSMMDPPRKGVKESIKICQEAGIKVVMITGDHPLTAKSIAKSLNIYREGDIIINGKEIENYNNEELSHATVFARVAPEDKLLIVKAHQAQKNIVAMTGDGVNDALALENADVGIAMGISGTDVAKNAADLILTDDSFTTIETALYHGRGLFNNIRANIVFLLVCNLVELAVLAAVQFFLDEAMFSSYQLYILYATIHFFPALGLMFDKYDRNIMKMPPKKPNEPVLNSQYIIMMVLQIITIAFVLMIVWLLITNKIYPVFPENEVNVANINSYGYIYSVNGTPEIISIDSPGGLEYIRLFKARTVCFLILIFSEMWVALESRSIKTSLFKGRLNIALYFCLLFLIGIILSITHIDLAMAYLVLTPLSLIDWVIIIGASLPVIIFTEIFKKI